VPAPPSSYLRFERAFRRGDLSIVLAEGNGVADELSAAGRTDLIPEVLVQIGSAHAAQDRYEPAATYLEQGLALAAEQAPPAPVPPPTPTGPSPRPPTSGGPFSPPPGGPYGAPPATPGLPGAPGGPAAALGSSAARRARRTNQLDWFEVALLDIRLRTGRYDDVIARVPRLVDPTHIAEIRFAATRAHAAALTAQGQFEGAHHLLNTAGGVAQRIRSRFRVALVEGDRAILLAAQGRLLESITAADRVLPSLIRPPVGEYQQWSNAEGAAIALTVCRAAAAGSDHLTAQRMLHLGTTATHRVGGAYLHAHLDLARGVVWLLEGDLDAAEASLVSAGRQFGVLGCSPAIALATMEQGRLAQIRGLVRSAAPLYLGALDDFRRLGQPREINELNRLLAGLPASAIEPRPGS
jgi:hypothetical protein